MLSADMIAALRCPVCHDPLRAQGSALRCPKRHSFDIARQGYVHLGSGKRAPEGDTAPMIEARLRFLDGGYFMPLTEALNQALGDGLIVDLGAGPGFHLSKALDVAQDAEGLAFDVSKPALRRAAKAHPRMGAVLADTWGDLPLADGCADFLLNVFAPRNGPQMRRVLRPGGGLVVVTPEPEHLIELRDRWGLLNVDESKPERLAATLDGFRLVSQEVLTWRMDLSGAAARDLILMGPNAFHGASAGAFTKSVVTASVRLSRWTGRPLPSRPADRDAGR